MLPCGPSSKSMLAMLCLLTIALRSADLSAAALNATSPGNAAATATATTAPTTAAAAATTKETTVQTTKKARKPRRLCAFPFWHRGQWHHQCLEYGSKGAQWCSLTQNFTRDEEWRECARYDLMRYKCTIPFHHGSKSHTQCQPLGVEPLALPTFWCALVPSLAEVTWRNLGVDWTFCEAPNATDVEYLKAVGNQRCLEEAVKPTAAAAAAAAAATTRTSVHSGVTTVHGNAVTTGVNIHGNVATTGVGIHGNAAVVVDAAKSISAASGDGASAGAAAGDGSTGSGPGSGLGISLGVVGVVLAAVAVAAAFMVHRRYFRNQYKRIDPLLSSEPAAEKGSYGGMQAYHD